MGGGVAWRYAVAHPDRLSALILVDASGQPMPVAAIMEGQIISKLVLSTIMVPPLIYLFVAIGRRLDRN